MNKLYKMHLHLAGLALLSACSRYEPSSLCRDEAVLISNTSTHTGDYIVKYGHICHTKAKMAVELLPTGGALVRCACLKSDR